MYDIRYILSVHYFLTSFKSKRFKKIGRIKIYLALTSYLNNVCPHKYKQTNTKRKQINKTKMTLYLKTFEPITRRVRDPTDFVNELFINSSPVNGSQFLSREHYCYYVNNVERFTMRRASRVRMRAIYIFFMWLHASGCNTLHLYFSILLCLYDQALFDSNCLCQGSQCVRRGALMRPRE